MSDITAAKERGVTDRLAQKYGMVGPALMKTLAKTIFPSEKDATNEQVAALCIVADQYDLNPFTKEIYAFPGKGGGIVPILGVDGYYKLLSRDKDVRGIKCEFHHDDDGGLFAATASIYKSTDGVGWEHPVEVTEYLSECKRNTPPWNNQPHRMLRHRAITQCARIAIGLTGVYAEDEAAMFNDGAREADVTVVEPKKIDLKKARATAKTVETKSSERGKPAPKRDTAPTKGTVAEKEEDPVELAVPEALFGDEEF